MTPPKDNLPEEFSTGDSAEGASLERTAYQALLDWLTQGHAKPGQLVPLREFARRFGMSRTPLRAAAGRLHEQGLLAYSERVGFTVAIPTTSDLYELFDLRLMLEEHALRRFLEMGGQPLPAELHRLVDETRALVDQSIDDPEKHQRFWRLDLRFHRTLVALAGSRRLLDWWDNLVVNIYVLQLGRTTPLTRDRFQKSAEEHDGIAAALAQGQGSLAVDLLLAHIMRVREQTIGWALRAAGRSPELGEPRWLSRTPSGSGPARPSE